MYPEAGPLFEPFSLSLLALEPLNLAMGALEAFAEGVVGTLRRRGASGERRAEEGVKGEPPGDLQ